MADKKNSPPRAFSAQDVQELRRDALLTRQALAEALTAVGFKTSAATLATQATRGGGPPYRVWGGKRPLYAWGEALDWAHGRLSKPVHTTSELEVA